jgi:FkbM family methyltransferase
MTTYMLSKAVGATGRVIAFEPDKQAYDCLLKNIRHHQLLNVTPVEKALAASTGSVRFNMDGTTAAGLSECLPYPATGPQVMVEAISFADACAEFGVPAFMKMDIEGAEVEVIRAALPVLRGQRVHLAFETGHRLPDGAYTWKPVGTLLRSIGYSVESSNESGQMFTWARPPALVAEPR